MLTVEIGGKRKQIPSSYNEITLEQLRVYVEFVERRKSEIFSLENGKVVVKDQKALTEAQSALLWAILDMKFRLFVRIGAYQIRDLVATEKLVDFFFTDLLTENKLPRIKRFRKSLYGPVNAFHRLSFEEFGFADNAFHQFNHTGDIKYLDELVATLYRPAKKKFDPKAADTDGDIRQEFNFLTIDFRMDQVAKMREVDKWCVYVWFDHCRRQLVERYKELFEKNDKKKSRSGGTWVETAMAIGHGVLNFNVVRKTPVYQIFMDLDRLRLDKLELEEEMEAAKNKRK